MFGPRRGYDAIGEPSVSNADKPRVQPVKAAFAKEIGDVKALLERELHYRTTLTAGDELKVQDIEGALTSEQIREARARGLAPRPRARPPLR